MNIAEQVLQAKQDLDDVYAAGYTAGQADVDTETAYNNGVADGKQAEYDRFWDEFQQNGERTTYKYAFAGTGWTEDTLKPKYPIKIVDTTKNSRRGLLMFCYLGIDRSNDDKFDMTEICKVVDFSEALSVQGVVKNAIAKNITINASKAMTLREAFGCNDGGGIDYVTLTVSSACTDYTNAFNYSIGLTNLTITEGSEIAADINFQWCPLTRASIESVMAALSDTTSGLAATFKKTAVDTAFETEEGLADGSTSEQWLALVATRENWTITLV